MQNRANFPLGWFSNFNKIHIKMLKQHRKSKPPTQQNRFTPAHAKPRQFRPPQNFRPRAPALINPADPPPYTRPFALAFRCGSTGPTARPAPSATCSLFQLGRPGSSAPPRPAYELSGLWIILILYYMYYLIIICIVLINTDYRYYN